MRQTKWNVLLVAAVICLTAQAAAKNKEEGCRFTRISPIPEGKAVIYMYKVGYGRAASAIAVNGKLETIIKKGGYYPLAVTPGEYSFELGVAFGWIPMGKPIKTIRVEAGKEYFLEYLTRFAGSFKEVAVEQGLKDLKNTKLLLPFKLYDFAGASVREVTDNEEIRELLYGKMRGRSEPLEYKEKFEGLMIGVPVEKVEEFWKIGFDGGRLVERRIFITTYGRYRAVVYRYGFAHNCTDTGLIFE